MPEFLQGTPITTLAAPFFVLLIIAEIILIKVRGKGGEYESKDAATSVLMGVGSTVVDGLLGFVSVALLLAAYNIAPAKLPINWVTGIACFVLIDIAYYWIHRYYHRSRWGWAAHVIHHSSQHYNLTTALRQTWSGLLSGGVLLFVPIALMGFHPLLMGFCYGLNLIYQFWFHTEMIDKTPRWFEAIMNTPSHHRVHHANNPRYLDSNYAGVFIVWDRMFGTFVAERTDDAPRYGLVSDLGTFNPLRVATHEYVGIIKDASQKGLSLKERLFYIFAEPGWCHDEGRKSSRQIKADYVALHPQHKGDPGL